MKNYECVGTPRVNRQAAVLAGGKIDSEAIWQWALAAAQQRRTEDAVIAAVMEMLCALPQDLWIEEDAQVMIDALHNPADQSDLSMNLLWNYPDIVDQRSRRPGR